MTKTDIPVYVKEGSTQKIGSLKKNEPFKLIEDKGTWLAVQFGNTTGYIMDKNITKYTVAPTKFSTPNLTTANQVTLKAEASVLNTAALDGATFATIEAGVQLPVVSVDERFYAVSMGGRTGYIKVEDVEIIEIQES